MHLGVIIFYLPAKGYGYLRLEGSREEFHFRSKDVRAQGLRKGDLVRFHLRRGRQGYYADGIVRADLA